jgi:hypothetical protein
MRAINIYTAKLKTRAQIHREIPRHLQGWWADVWMDHGNQRYTGPAS